MASAVLWKRRGGAGRGDCQLTEEPIASRDNGRRRRLWWERKSSPGGCLCSRRGRGPPQHHGDHRQHAARAGESSGPEPGWGSGAWGRTPQSWGAPSVLLCRPGASRVVRSGTHMKWRLSFFGPLGWRKAELGGSPDAHGP